MSQGDKYEAAGKGAVTKRLNNVYQRDSVMITLSRNLEKLTKEVRKEEKILSKETKKGQSPFSRAINALGYPTYETGNNRRSGAFKKSLNNTGIDFLNPSRIGGSSAAPKAAADEAKAANKPMVNQLSRIVDNGIIASKMLTSLWGGVSAIRKLDKVPSILSGVLKLLEFGFLLTLKPLADLLAAFLMPIALKVIEFAVWMNEQNKLVKDVFAVLSGIALGIMMLVSTAAGRGILSGAAKAVGGLSMDAIQSSLGKVAEWIGTKIVPKLEWAFEKSGLKAAWEWCAKAVGEFLVSSGLKDSWIKISERIALWFEESRIGKVLLSMGVKIGEFLEGSGIKAAFEKVGSYTAKDFFGILVSAGEFISKWFKIGLIAEIIGAVAGWISDFLGPKNPWKHVLLFIADVCVAVATFVDIIGWIIDACRDIWAALHGDFSFKNITERLTEICMRILQAFGDVYNMVASTINKYFKTDLAVIDFHAADTAKNNEQKAKEQQLAATVPTTTHTAAAANGYVAGSAADPNAAMNKRQKELNERDAYDGANKNGSYVDSNGKTHIKAYANGGIITSPTIGLVGEAGPEAIIPLSEMGSMGLGSSVNITVTGIMDKYELKNLIGDIVDQKLNKHTRVNGSLW